MTKFVWMSDPHFQNEGTIRGLNPRKRLTAALDHANNHYADAEFVVISGDLVGDDIEGDYSAIAECFAASKLPVYPMVGNNDDRAGFFKHLKIPEPSLSGFVQYTIETEDGLVVCLDTHNVGSHAGEFCQERSDWLRQVLHDAKDRPVFIIMHHPPKALGLPKQDEIMLTEADAFLDLIGEAGNVRHIFAGHVHRSTFGTARGIPIATLGALSFQAPAPRPSWDWDSFVPAEEAPAYAVVDLAGGDVSLQLIQFCDFAFGHE